MKILATGVDSTFIAEVSRHEIEKVLDKYYAKLDMKLEPGVVVNLAGGHDFRGEIQSACRQMSDAMKQFERARAILMSFAIMVSNLPTELRPGTESGDA